MQDFFHPPHQKLYHTIILHLLTTKSLEFISNCDKYVYIYIQYYYHVVWKSLIAAPTGSPLRNMDSHTPPLITLIAVQIPSNSQNSQNCSRKMIQLGLKICYPEKKVNSVNHHLAYEWLPRFFAGWTSYVQSHIPWMDSPKSGGFLLGKNWHSRTGGGPNPSRLWWNLGDIITIHHSYLLLKIFEDASDIFDHQSTGLGRLVYAPRKDRPTTREVLSPTDSCFGYMFHIWWFPKIVVPPNHLFY